MLADVTRADHVRANHSRANHNAPDQQPKFELPSHKCADAGPGKRRADNVPIYKWTVHDKSKPHTLYKDPVLNPCDHETDTDPVHVAQNESSYHFDAIDRADHRRAGIGNTNALSSDG